MIDWNSIKLMFVDYDDTACIHMNMNTNYPTHEDYIRACVNDSIYYYVKNQAFMPNPCLRWFLDRTRGKFIPTYILTWSNSNRLIKARKAFLERFYGDSFKDVLISVTREYKIEIAKQMADVQHIPYEDVLIIEDHPNTLNEFRKAGFTCLSTAELQVLFFEHLDKGYLE